MFRCFRGDRFGNRIVLEDPDVIVMLNISGLNASVAASLRYADYGDHLADWHSLGTVNCANQIRLCKPLISNGLGRRHISKRRERDSNPRYELLRTPD